MKRIITSLAVLGLAALTGCGSLPKGISHLALRQGTAAAVRWQTGEHPTAIPAVKLAGEIICSAANQTNLSPAAVIAQIEASNWMNIKTPESIWIIEGVIGGYTLAYNSFGADVVKNNPELRLYLGDVCDGIRDVFPVLPLREGAPQLRAPDNAWPHLKF